MRPFALADVLKAYANASIVGPERVVFNIRGNDYRLVVAINHRHQIVFIKMDRNAWGLRQDASGDRMDLQVEKIEE
jgi:HigB_toxin, RelE-like toxic component of a toxin-antitoxin system